MKGESNPNYIKGKIKCTCLWCGKEFYLWQSRIKKGGGKYCSPKCYVELHKKEPNCICRVCGKKFYVMPSGIKRGEGKYCSVNCYLTVHYNGGKKVCEARAKARRRRSLGYILLLPLGEGEIGHHITNTFVIGIPKEAHEKCNGNREGHRRKVLKWLKFNDKRKYSLVIAIFKSNRSR